MIRVLIVDDHPLLRLGVREMLGGVAGVLVVGEAGSGRVAVELAAELQPDVVVIDLTMPYDEAVAATRTSATGLDAIASIKAASAAPPAMIVLSVHGEAAIVRSALRAGASGYVLKESVSADLDLAIRAAAVGSVYFSAEVAAVLGAPAGSPVGPPSRLSPREREVVEMVVEGLSTKQIASRLSTSPKTVERQRRNAMQKLGTPNVAALVRSVTSGGLRS